MEEEKSSRGKKKKRICLIDSTAPVIELSQVSPLMTCLTQEKRSIFLLGLCISQLHISASPKRAKESKRRFIRHAIFILEHLTLQRQCYISSCAELCAMVV